MNLFTHFTSKPMPVARGSKQGRASLSGFSLIEVMVAMAIGMLGIIIMMQVFRVFESQKRTTTGGDDANSTGGLALYSLQRNIEQSGWGISALGGDQDVSLLGCTVSPSPAFVSDFSATPLPLVPVSINSSLITGQDANTDTLLIVSGSSSGSVEGDEVTGLVVKTPQAVSANDRVVTVPFSGACAGRVLGKYSSLNFDADGVRLYNLGPQPSVMGYAVRNGNLTACDFVAKDCITSGNNSDQTVWVPIATNVVSLRAEYGRDTTSLAALTALGSMDGVVDNWDQLAAPTAASLITTPVSNYALKNTLGCAWARVTTIRLAIAARSNQPEKPLDGGGHVTSVVTIAPSITTPVPWMGSDGVAYESDPTEARLVEIVPPSPDVTWPTWQDYRYKVFQTVVPLRNIDNNGAVKGMVPKC